MRYYIFLIIALLNFLTASCGRNSKANSQANLEKDSNRNIEDLIIGEWKRNNDPLYSLDFKKQDNGEIECVFSTGGPFEEYLTCKVISDKSFDLYFKGITGSVSFMNSNTPSDQDSCRIRVISCFLTNENQLLVNSFEDKCGQIFEEKNIMLTRETE